MANWDTIRGSWKQIAGEARAQWGKLTGDEWEQIGGNKDRLVGKLQEHYGWKKEEAQRNVDDWFDTWERRRGTTTTTGR